MEREGSTLHLILGPWGAGKSTLAERLPKLLPEHVIFDWDLVIPGLALATGKDAFRDSSTWEGLYAIWLAIIQAVLDGGHNVVLCCSVQPVDIPLDVVSPRRIRAAYIDCSDDELRARLGARRESAGDIGGELAEATALRQSSYFRLDGARDPDALAEAAAMWILGNQAVN